ncbi:MAG: DUF2264 domain-containing protein [Opitutaceae bacterium]|nr:DUF2264 domain-containing protein [Opitutaceae bacterium]
MSRRDFLVGATSAIAAGAALPRSLRGQLAEPAAGLATREELTARFRAITAGFLRHARTTSADYTACDFPGGTMIKGCCTPSGKTYTSVARMLPALAEYAAAKQPRLAGEPDLTDVVRSIFRTAFDPKHPDYWGEPVGNKPTQRTVESSLVAIALARMGPDFVGALSARERTNINQWLASCTVIPERTNNHAWFTAVNQAARLKLSRTFPEFKGDEAWPHSPGLLRRIMRKNFAWWWNMGAFDEERGKLRETLSPGGAPAVTEGYIDNGHPYWAMQAFTFFSIPATDPLWTAPEEDLPVEKSDFAIKLAGPKMIIAGTKTSGQVRWLQAMNASRRDYYRDKYNKFTWSSAFPFNVLQGAKDFAPWDQTLVFRDLATGVCAARIFPDHGELLDDGVRTSWRATLGSQQFKVSSTIRLAGDFEFRRHVIELSNAAAVGPGAGRIQAIEGSHALGLADREEVDRVPGADWTAIRSRRSGKLLVGWKISGHEAIDVVQDFDPKKEPRVNLVDPRVAVLSWSKQFKGVAAGSTIELTSLHYASPKPEPMERIYAHAARLIRRWV